MAIRDSYVVGTKSLDVEEVRLANGAHWTPATNAIRALTGIRAAPGDPAAVTATGTPNGFVHVAPAQVVIQSTRTAGGGAYTLTWDATVDINILSTPANATNPRNDLIIAYQPDTFYGDANSDPVVRQVVGNPSGSPADPSLAAFPDAVTLARVRVNANATTITTSNITDLRPAQTVGHGGILPTATATTRNAVTGLYEGLTVWRKDRDWLEVYDGTSFDVMSIPVVSSVADLAAITNPSTGLVAYNSGDLMVYRWTGSAWRVAGTWTTTTLLAAPAASITISNIPTYLKNLRIVWTGATSLVADGQFLHLRVNGDTGNNYRWVMTHHSNGTVTGFVGNAVPQMVVGVVAGNGTTFASGTIDIAGWNSPHSITLGQTFSNQHIATGSVYWSINGGGHYSQAGPYTSVTLVPASASNFLTGTQVTVTGSE